MNHLSEKQISEWLAGTHRTDVQAHIQVCAQCQAEVDRLSDALVSFRGTVHQWAAVPNASRAVIPETGVARRFRFAWAMAAIFIVLAASLWWPRLRAPRAVTPHPDDDAALLLQIRTDVSRNVPGPMEPLSRLTPSDSATVRDTQ